MQFTTLRIRLLTGVCVYALLLGAEAARAELVAWWNLADGAGTTALDTSPSPVGGVPNNGTLMNIDPGNWNNGLSGLTDGITMPHGLMFDGHANQSIGDPPDGDHISLDAHAGDFEAMSQGSISAWFRRTQDADPNDNAILGFYNSTNNNYIRLQIETPNSGVRSLRATEASADDSTDNADGITSSSMGDNVEFVDDGNWHNVIFTTDGSSSSMYLDGNLIATGTQGFTAVDIDGMAIGFVDRADRPLWYFDGTLGDIRIYDEVLNRGQVAYISDPLNYGDGLSQVPEPTTISLLAVTVVLVALGYRKQSRCR